MFVITLSSNLAELHVCVLRSFIKSNKAPTKFSEAFTKLYQGLMEIFYQNIIVNDYTTKLENIEISIYI